MSAPAWLAVFATLVLGVEGEPVLGESAGPAIVEALGYHADELAVGRHVLNGIEVRERRIAFSLATPGRDGESGGLALVGVHPSAPVPEPGLEVAYRGAALVLYAARPVAPALVETARVLGEKLSALPWVTPDAGPPLAPAPVVEELFSRQSPDGSRAWVVSPPVALALVEVLRALAPLVTWSTLVLLALGLGRALRAAPAPGRGLALAGLALAALTLRLALASPWPISFVEVERVLPARSCAFAFTSEALRPLVAWAADPLAAQGLANLCLGALAVVATALLGELWLGGRLGWLAGAFLVVAPLQLLFARTSTIEVGLAALVPLALVATELALRARGRLAGLTAALAWTVTLQVRPESVGLALIPVAFVLLDLRGRRWLGDLRRSAPAVAVLGIGVAASLARTSLCWPEPALDVVSRDVLPRAATVLLENAWDLLLDPRWHDASLLALALAGLLFGRGAWRVVAALGGLVLPIALFSLKGRAVGADAFDVTDLRYVLGSQPLLAVAAAALPVRVAELAPGLARRAATLVTAALVAWALAAPALRFADFAAPAPLQAEHEFLARALPLVPPDAAVLVFDTNEIRDASCTQLDYRLHVLASQQGRPERPRVVDPDEAAGLPTDVRLYYLRGWFELRSAGLPQLAVFRRDLDARFVREPVLEERARVRAGGEPGELELLLGLYELRSKGPVTP